MPVPDAFPAPPDTMEAAADTATATPNWQQYFTDERLRAVIERPLADNRDLRIAALRVEQAAALHRIQRGKITPSIGVQAAGELIRLPERMTGGDAKRVEQYAVEVGFMAWEIDLFGRLRSLTESPRQQYLASKQAQRLRL